MRDIKIQQTSELEPAELKIAQQLSAMHQQDRQDRLEFDHHRRADQKIDPTAVLDRQLVVADWDKNLAAHPDALLFEFVHETGFVRALEQSRANRRMDFHGRADDRVSEILLDHLRVLCVSIASFALPTLLRQPRPGAAATSLPAAAGF